MTWLKGSERRRKQIYSVATLEAARELVNQSAIRDAKVKDRDLHDRLQKQTHARNSTNDQLGCSYMACTQAALTMHKRPQFELTAGGYTQMPLALKQAASEQLEYHMRARGSQKGRRPRRSPRARQPHAVARVRRAGSWGSSRRSTAPG